MITPLRQWNNIGVGYRQGDPTFYNDWHLGLDKMAVYDTKIYAPCDGKIIVAGVFTQGGNTVWFEADHPFYGKLIFRFLHLSKKYPLGHYKEGDVIGKIGNTGAVSPRPTFWNPRAGTHLHHDISLGTVILNKRENFIDPEIFYQFLNVKQEPMTFYKEDKHPAIYYKGADGKYYPINSGISFKKLFGDFNDHTIISVPFLENKGERLGLVI